MTRFVRSALVPAEYYYWHDGRDETDLLLSRRQFDPDPDASARIAEAITQRRQASEPGWSPELYGPGYFDTLRSDIDQALVAAASAFATRQPARLADHDVIEDFTDTRHRTYVVVSATWKQAIESLEPDTHQFLPHTFQFTDGVVDGHFILRLGGTLDLQLPSFNADAVEDRFEQIIGYALTVGGRLGTITLDRATVEGHHLIRSGRHNGYIVSRRLAETLYPLLPDETGFVPLAISGGGEARDAIGAKTAPPGLSPEDFAGLDPALADAMAALSGQEGLPSATPRERAFDMVEARTAGGTAADIFRIMAVSLRFEGPLSRNAVFQTCWLACHAKPERDVLAQAKPWAQSADPLRRVAAVRALSRPVDTDEAPNRATFAVLTALLDDPDPLVLEQAIGIVAWIGHPAYADALRSRRTALEGHPDAEVRAVYHALVTSEDEPQVSEEEQTLRAELGGADIAGIFAAAADLMRAEDGVGVNVCLRMLRDRPEPGVAAVAWDWARRDDHTSRLIAARALDRPIEQSAPAPLTIDAIRVLLASRDKPVVVAALAAFGAVTHWGPYQPHQIAPVRHCADDPDPDIRKAYAGLFARPGSATTLAELIALSRDPSPDVRLPAAMALQNSIAHMDGDRAGLAAVRAALTPLLGDASGWVRISAIDGLSALGDPLAADAIVAELARDPSTMLGVLDFLMAPIIRRPDRRYLPGLQAWLGRFPTHYGIKAAIKACTVKRWFPW